MSGRAGSGGSRAGLGPRGLLVLLAACVAMTSTLIYLALAHDGSGDDAAVVEGGETPFRGGQLPPDLAGAAAPAFSHDDARGGETGTADMAGRPYVVTFLYTDCPDVCPLIAQQLREALELLGPHAKDVGVLAVSVDPAGDTRSAVRAWLAAHELPPNFHYLVGTEEQLAPTWEAYLAAPQPAGEAESAHTAAMWLVDSEGRLRTRFSGGLAVGPADIAHDLRLLLDDAERRSAAGPGAVAR